MNRAAERFHPAVGLCYYLAVLSGAMLFLHPYYLLAGLLGAALSGAALCGPRPVAKTLLFALPFSLLFALLNPFVSHGGVTALFYIRGSAVTLESFFYGLCSGATLLLVILWFCSFARVLTPERLLFLFARFAPASALLVTMTQRMLALFRQRAARIAEAQKTLQCDLSQGPVRARFRAGVRITTILLTWSLESGLDTADSMKARGYGAARRSHFSLYRFRARDAAALAVIVCLTAAALAGYYASAKIQFYPAILLPRLTPGAAVSLVAFGLLGLLPAAAALWEVAKWRS